MLHIGLIIVALLACSGGGTVNGSTGFHVLCTCFVPPPTEESIRSHYEHADFVFVGRVVWIAFPESQQIQECLAELPVDVDGRHCNRALRRFSVSRAWKGVESDTITLTTWGFSCGYPFQAGREYIVYASAHPNASVEAPRAHSCSGTKLVAEAGLDLEVLGPPEYDWSQGE